MSIYLVIRKIQTSKKEVINLVIAWLSLSLAVALLFSRSFFRLNIFLELLIVSFITAGSGFLFHELSHKFVAQRYGCWAEFRANYQMLVLAVASGAAGFLFAAPGAVEIRGNVTLRNSGIIAIAGPLMNLFLYFLFLFISFFNSNTITNFGIFINSFLAAFNMLPFGPLDGKKVLNWNKIIFAIVFVFSILVAIHSFISL